APVNGPVTDTEGRTWLTIATTRPETIPGDTAVAVNPKDLRYAHLIGKHVVRPLPRELPRQQKLVPIVGDDHVDFEFGTGVLKVTPAHDKADFDIGQRHGLAVVDIMHPDGKMNDLAGADLRGLDRFEARKVAVEKLRELGSLVDEKPYENSIGFSQRAEVPIEPRLSEQWFLKYPSVEKSRACVAQEGSATVPVADSGVSPESSSRAGRPVGGTPTGAGGTPALPGKMRFHPQRWAKVYDHWLANIQDWCISRQLWWGHRIPVWHRGPDWYEKQTKDSRKASSEFLHQISNGDPARVILRGRMANAEMEPDDFEFLEFQYTTVCLAPEAEHMARKLEELGYTQDPDVLDTWFSSWLWPFATMGWPELTPTLKKFYPTTDLVTAPEIIFFWVARMIMAGYEYMGDLPFRNVYFNGIVRDKQGRKMSKSLGNSPDPLDLIAQYGADAIRFGTMRAAPLGQDVLFDEKDVELGRNFCNKLWNACRFRQMQGGEVQGEIDGSRLSSDDKWILLKLHQAIKEITASLAAYNFSEATASLYRFFWNEYCDWYVESSKAVLARPVATDVESLNHLIVESESAPAPSAASTLQPFNPSTTPVSTPPPPRAELRRKATLAVMDFVLSHTLRLFHPFLPFITEELWHGMGFAEDMPENQGGKSIMFAPWPKPFDSDTRDHYSLDDCYLEFASLKQELVTQGRNLRREANISAAKKITFVLKPSRDLPPNDIEVMRLLLNAKKL
ncbi:MAG TPA: class I tRNA ligase family protein, partial [Verrucomicrobiae bacterium]